MFKRAIDVGASAIALLLLLPVMACVAIAIQLDSRGPVFFRQVRVGRDCREFRIFKFRSMVVDAPRLGGFSTEPGDPRITRVGRWIRKTSVDELPQVLNVLAGDMSLVGPRPDVPAQRAGYRESDWIERHRVRPGITGLAQATLRSSATPAERLELDLRYVREQSLWLDIRIVFATVRQLVRSGSY